MKNEHWTTTTVHSKGIGPVKYFPKGTARPFISAELQGSTEVDRWEGVRKVGYHKGEGDACIYLSLDQAARLRDRLTDALLEAGYVPEPQTETVG